MSEEGDTFWVSLAEKFFGIILIIIGAIMLYFTATSTSVLGGFSLFFGILSLIMLIIGLFLLLVRPPE
ncbi:MAG: hypothetical protein ABSB10_07080 [Candidatus Bathyarchaeia archaeon]|jgi:predicted ferric reductase